MDKFKLHCQVHELREDKKAALLLTSIDSQTYDELQDQCNPKKLIEIPFSELEDMLIKIYKSRTNFRTKRFVFHRMMQHPEEHPDRRLREHIEESVKYMQSWHFC